MPANMAKLISNFEIMIPSTWYGIVYLNLNFSGSSEEPIWQKSNDSSTGSASSVEEEPTTTTVINIRYRYRQCCGSGMFTPDPKFSIPDPGQNFIGIKLVDPDLL
jgi:hypothetical protein